MTRHRQGVFDIEGGRPAGQSRRGAARAGLPRQARVALRDRRTERCDEFNEARVAKLRLSVAPKIVTGDEK